MSGLPTGFATAMTPDPAYDNVILHVVGLSDRRIPPPRDGLSCLRRRIAMPEGFYRTFLSLSSGIDSVRCGQ